LIVLGVLATIVAIKVNSKAYWLAGLFMYIASFLSGFSIGLYLLVLLFTLWVLALAHSLNWIKNQLHYVLFVAIGVLLWIISITTIDDYWLYYPISWFV
jgi:hypothetical protein